MTDLADVLGSDERDCVEWKRNADDRDVIRRAICALANDLPRRGEGHLLIGIRNDGSCDGLTVDDALLLVIANMRNEARILPRPVFSVEKATYRGCECVHVRVEPSHSPPIRLDGVCYVRVGTSTRRGHREEEQILTERRRAADLPFDQNPVRGTSIQDLDLELFKSTYLPAAIDPDVLAENQRPIELQLASLGLLDGSSNAATAGGLLVVGLDPSAWIPGAYIQFVRYQGDDAGGTVLDQEELRGNAVGQLTALGGLLAANLRTAVRDVDGSPTGRSTGLSHRRVAGIGGQRHRPPRLRDFQRPGSHHVVHRTSGDHEPRWPVRGGDT